MTDTVARSRERKESLEDILVVDADVHVHESPGALIPYCEMPWRVALENIKDVQEFYLDMPASRRGRPPTRPSSPRAGSRMVHDAEQMRRELDEIHVDIGILFPDHFLKIPVIAQIDYAAALARAYNAWLLDKWCHPDKGSWDASSRVPRTRRTRRVRSGITRKNQAWSGCSCRARGSSGSGATGSTTRSTSSCEADLPVLLHSVTVIHPVFPFNTQGFETGLDSTSAAIPSR